MTQIRSRLISPPRRATIGIFLLIAISSGVAGAAAQARITGEIEIDLISGRIAGDVCVSGLPLRGDTAVFALNRAFAISEIIGAADPPARLEPEPGGAAIRYTVTGVAPEPHGSVGTPTGAACIEYVGAEPVYDLSAREYRDEDDGSVIAFGTGTVRARGASRWYPAPHDAGTGLTSEAVAFDVRVICSLCDRIYVNGILAERGADTAFSSERPRELFLLAGDLPVRETDGGRIIGELTAPDTAAIFFETLGKIQGFYADYLGIPYGRPPDVVLFTPVRRPRDGLVWGFFSDPALALSGMSIGQLVVALAAGSSARPSVFGFLAHELAHRYFGWGIGTGSPQRDLFGEPFATYLELKAVRHFLGEAQYALAVRNLRERARSGPELPSMDRAGPDDLADAGYRYSFGPLQLLSLESAIGEERFLDILRRLLRASPSDRDRADYALLRSLALESGVSQAEWNRWESGCLHPRMSQNGCLASVGG